MNKYMIITVREYLKVVRKKSFWITTLLMPALIVVVSFISGYTSGTAEDRVREAAEKADNILIVDSSSIINEALIQTPFSKVESKEDAIYAVQYEDADAVFIYEEGLLENKTIEVYVKHDTLLTNGKFDSFAREVLRQSLLLEIDDEEKRSALDASFGIQLVAFEEGEIMDKGFESLIIPAITLFLFFIMNMFAVNFLLLSVSEEKENRMIETILSTVSPKELISGKIFGQIGVVFTQVLLFIVLGVGGLFVIRDTVQLPINLSSIVVDPWQIVLALTYIILAFFFIASVMIGLGAVMPTYRDAQQTSGLFVILTVLPIYFITIIMTDPTGLVSMITSYTPFTAPLVLLLRNGLGALPTVEIAISIVVLIVYAVVSWWIAIQLFKIGSLEYNEKLSMKRIINSILSRDN